MRGEVRGGGYCALLLVLLLHLPGVAYARCFFSFDSRNAKFGNFSSPGYPDPYPGGALCHFHFRGRPWEGVRLLFHHFDLQPPYHAGCLSDYVELLTVDVHNTQRFRGRHCGEDAPAPLLVLTPGVELVFRSGQHVTSHRGFHGEYEFVDEETVTPPTPDDDAPQGCGGVISGIGGVLQSPEFPSPFPGGLDCVWLLRASYNHYLYLRVIHLHLHTSSGSDCRRAQLTFLDGYGPHDGSGKPLRTYCGNLAYHSGPEERVLLSPRNRLLVRFTSAKDLAPAPVPSTAAATASDPALAISKAFGFRIVWTQIAFDTAENCTSRGQFVCRHSEFCIAEATGGANGGGGSGGGNPGGNCVNRRFYCVAPSLVCDGRANCQEGDNSDEMDCYVSLLVAASIAAPVVLLLPALLICACHRKRTRRKKAAALLRTPVNTDTMTPLRPRPLHQSPSRTRPQQLDGCDTSGDHFHTCGLISPASGFSDPLDDEDSELSERPRPPMGPLMGPFMGNGFCPAHGGYIIPHSSLPSSSGSPGRGSLTSDATCRLQSSPGPSSRSSPAPRHAYITPTPSPRVPRQRQAATMTSPSHHHLPSSATGSPRQFMTPPLSQRSLLRPQPPSLSQSTSFLPSDVTTVTTFGVLHAPSPGGVVASNAVAQIPTMSQRATDV